MNRRRSDRPKTYQIGVVGDRQTGKSALIAKLCVDVFVEYYDPCQDDYLTKQLAVDGRICVLEMLELESDMHTFSALWELWVRSMHGIVMVYSIDSRSSFMKVRAFYHRIIKIIIERGGDVDDYPLFLIGNKSEDKVARVVSTAEGAALAQEFCCEFIETSAKNALHVEEPFCDIVRVLRSREAPQIVGSKATYRGLFRFIRQAFRRRSFHRQKLQTSVQSPGTESVKASRKNDQQPMKKRVECRVNSEEQSAFYAAAATDRSNTVKMLLAKGADVSAKGPGGMRPLQVAALEGHVNVVRLLLANGAPIDERTRMHGTALICAISRANIGVVRVLLDHGADVNAKGGLYGNALQAAATLGKVDLARLLLDSGANVDATGDGGFTALQVAAFPGRFDMIELLLSRGAPPELQLATPSSIICPFHAQDGDDPRCSDVMSHFDYGDSEVVRASAQVIVDLIHHHMSRPAKEIEQETSRESQ